MVSTADPRRLAVLLAVRRAGGVLAAADLLRVTPSAVSQQIAKLEAEEHVLLLDRGPRGVTLTPAGRILADAAERIEGELVEARKAVLALTDEPVGEVVLGVLQTPMRTVVLPAVADLAERLPGIELEIQEHEEPDALRLLRGGELDLVFLERDIDEGHDALRGMREVVLLDEPWRMVIPEHFPIPAQLPDVIDTDWLAPLPGTAADRAMERVAAEFGPLRTRHMYANFDVALAMVGANMGVALLPALALAGLDDSSGVRIVALPGLGSRQLVLRHRATRHEPRPAVAAVRDAVVAAAGAVHLG